MNLPGITTEHPHGRCQLPITRERFFKDERLRAVLAALREEQPMPGATPPRR
jgi:hypothetical protein